MQPEVVEVNRTKEGIARKVIIEVERMRITFILYAGRLREIGRTSMEGKLIDGPEPHSISRTALY